MQYKVPRHSDPSVQLLFLNIVLTGEIEYVSKGNIFICFNVIVNEKSEKANKYVLKIGTNRLRFLGC